MSKLRLNEDADALISGTSPHPLLSFQQANRPSLQLLGVLILTATQSNFHLVAINGLFNILPMLFIVGSRLIFI